MIPMIKRIQHKTNLYLVKIFKIQLSIFKSFIFKFSPVSKTDLGALILKNKSFDVLGGYVGDTTLRRVKEMGFTEMTDIQAQSIPHLLERRFIL